MALDQTKNYFVKEESVVLRASAREKSNALNHLLFGDQTVPANDTNGPWVKVRCRRMEGWVREAHLTDKRPLEINFMDCGQGDAVHMVTPNGKITLIDAGRSNHLYRLIAWRYNLRDDALPGIDVAEAGAPGSSKSLKIDQVVITHPDEDHYYGFRHVFGDPKITVRKVFHNGIVERPISSAERATVKAKQGIKHYSDDDLGRYLARTNRGPKHLWDVVRTDADLRALIETHRSTGKHYLSTLREAVDNPANSSLKFKALSANQGFLSGFGSRAEVSIELMGPVTEEAEFDGETRDCLLRLGGEAITKNGHSVVLKLEMGRFKMLLGGDLNTQAEDYLFRRYCDVNFDASDLEKTVYQLERKGPNLSPQDRQELEEARSRLAALVIAARRHFQVDVAKACHHGSNHFSETFLKAVNSLAVVISSGDHENYAHPRPDALGAFGKYGRGGRPLLFSTEIARNTKEFTPLKDYFDKIREFEASIETASSKSDRNRLTREMEEAKDSNVVMYGMITLRSDGEKVILAQKLEVPGGDDDKWDIHQLTFNENTDEFEYMDRTKLSH